MSAALRRTRDRVRSLIPNRQIMVPSIRSTCLLLLDREATSTPCEADSSSSLIRTRPFTSSQWFQKSKKPIRPGGPLDSEKHRKSLDRAAWLQDRVLGVAWLKLQQAEQERNINKRLKARKIARLQADMEYLAAKRRALDAFREFGTEPGPSTRR